MDRFIGGTAGLAPRGGNVSEDEVAAFLKNGGAVTRCDPGVSAISSDRRGKAFRKASRNGGRVMSDKSMREMVAERQERLADPDGVVK